MSIRRRTVLGGGAASLAVAGLPGCRPEEDGGPPVAGRIDHVIVVMMENRTFDHYLGALQLVEGWDIDGLDGSEQNADSTGQLHSVYHQDEPCLVADPPHGWGSSHKQYNDGACDGFVLQHEDRHGLDQAYKVMGYLNRDDLPVHYALADHFCVPDRFFASVMSSTWPNRFYAQTASSKGITGNDPHPDGYDQKSIYQAMDDCGASWGYYYTDIPFIGLLEDHWEGANIGFVEDFIRDATNGDLPAFTWIDPGFSYNDDHPPHHAGLGQLFLALVYEALAQSPLWERCLLVITYDEHGGFYDHVPPPTTDDDYADQGFDQMGFRVPALVVGPWVKQGVESTVFDNTSVLKYAVERFGGELWNARLAGVNSLEAALDTDRMAANEPLAPIVLPSFEVPQEELTDDCDYNIDGARRSNQPELEDWVREHMPDVSRLDQIPQIHERLMAHARRLGLLG